MSAYPNAVFGGVGASNGETIYSSDPNTIAAEISAVETIFGTNPQIESMPVTGTPIAYDNVSDRISHAMRQDTHPYVDLSITANFTVGHFSSGQAGTIDYAKYNPPYTTNYQPPYANAGHAYATSGYITIRDTGLWYVEASQIWDRMASPQGYVKMLLEIGSGNIQRSDIFNFGQFQTGGTNAFGETYAYQNGYTHASFLGIIGAGTTIRVLSGNSTPVEHFTVETSTLRAYMLRPTTFVYDLQGS